MEKFIEFLNFKEIILGSKITGKICGMILNSLQKVKMHTIWVLLFYKVQLEKNFQLLMVNKDSQLLPY